MKNLVPAIIALLLSSCATDSQEIAKNCPQIGINVANPDFYQKHNGKELADFYACMYRNTSEVDPLISHTRMGVLLAPQVSRESLMYQVNLWTQILKKQKTREGATEAWMVWQKNNQMIAASNNAASAAEDSAMQSRMNANMKWMNANRPVNCVSDGMYVNCM